MCFLITSSFRQFPKSPWELEFTVSHKVFKHWRLLGTETIYDVSKGVFKDMCDGDSGVISTQIDSTSTV